MPSSNMYLLSSKPDIETLQTSKFQFYAIYFEFFSFYVLSFFINKTSANSLCAMFLTTFLLTPFTFLFTVYIS